MGREFRYAAPKGMKTVVEELWGMRRLSLEENTRVEVKTWRAVMDFGSCPVQGTRRTGRGGEGLGGSQERD